MIHFIAAALLAFGTPHDAALTHRVSPSDYWGGDYTTKAGEHVTVYVSRSYPEDDAFAQQWVDYLGSLLHGPELSDLTLYLATPDEVSTECGGVDIRGCYGDDQLVAPGEDESDISAKSVLAHEYGHHVASHRLDDPWPAVAWGTKRWSSYINVCKRANAQKLFPGSEDPSTYKLNPGEGFAESYRLLNERRLHLPSPPWRVVDDSLKPSAKALSLLQQDVMHPWTAPTTLTRHGTFGKTGTSTRTFKIVTKLDGTLTASVQGGVAEQLKLNTASTTVCGSRKTTLRVTRISGSGRFTLTVTRP